MDRETKQRVLKGKEQLRSNELLRDLKRHVRRNRRRMQEDEVLGCYAMPPFVYGAFLQFYYGLPLELDKEFPGQRDLSYDILENFLFYHDAKSKVIVIDRIRGEYAKVQRANLLPESIMACFREAIRILEEDLSEEEILEVRNIVRGRGTEPSSTDNGEKEEEDSSEIVLFSEFTDKYDKLGMKKEIQPFEDGFRSKPKRGNYEWWYFDAKLTDGSSLVIVFHTGPIASFSNGFQPYVTFDLTKPDGLELHREYHPEKGDFSFATDHCEVRIGNCLFQGDLNHYEILYRDEEVKASVTLQGTVPSWRPKSGHIYFNEADYFAWLPCVPEGTAEAQIQYKGEEYRYEGTGYHDHNWGNKPMFFLMHHWYWGRAKVGDYTIVSSFITADKKRNFAEIPIFMIAKDGKILADDAENCLLYTETDYEVDEVTKKHVARTLIYDYYGENVRYKVTYTKTENIERMGMETQLTWWQYPIIWLMGLRGSYHRIGGTVTLEVYENGEPVEKVTAPAIYEQMYFGKDRIRE